MKHDVQQESELRRYLLGELSHEEQVLVEQRLFLDSDYAELSQVVEDDLIDEYLADEVVGSDREKFENHFLLLPEHRVDLRIAKALKNYAQIDAGDTKRNSPAPVPTSFFNRQFVWLSLAVAALVVIAVVTWIAIRSTRGPAADSPHQAGGPQPSNTRPDERQQPGQFPKNDNREQTAEKGNVNGSGTKAENSNKPLERSVPQIATYALVAGGSPRATGPKTNLVVASGTTAIEFRLALELAESYEKYRAELLSGEHKINEISDLKSESDEKYGSVVSVTFPANSFRERSYRIKLYGLPVDQQPAEPPSIYSFSISRK